MTRSSLPRFALCMLLVALHMVLVTGCTTKEQLTYLPAELHKPIQAKILSAVLKTGGTVTFDKTGGTYFETERNGRLYRGIAGVTAEGQAVDLDMETLLEVRLERTEISAGGTIVLIVLAVPAVLFIALAVDLTAHPIRSCPYVYAYDGSRYVFDGQSYAGAITRALKRDDFTRLDSLRPVGGRYHLMLRNDPPNEIQYTDEVKLLVVDHAPSTHVSFEYDGTPYIFTSLRPPLASHDGSGRNLQPFFAGTDGIVWQSELPADTSYRHQPLTDELRLGFARPADPARAALVIHGGSGYWGSVMIERFIGLRGDHVGAWYHDLENGGPALRELRRLAEGDQLYHLRVDVLEPSGWTTRGMIHSGSSLADEERVIPLDLRNVRGDTVWIRLRPPRGFWKFDGITLAGGQLPPPRVTVLEAVEARDDNGVDPSGLLRSKDERSYVQARPMEALRLWFDVPPSTPSTDRTLFLKTSGYYLIRTDTTGAERGDIIARLFASDSAAVRFALDECYALISAPRGAAGEQR